MSSALFATSSGFSASDEERSRDLSRSKLAATALLAFSFVVAVVTKIFESRHWSIGYVGAWAQAATIGGLADWYAVVALFKHPLGIPLPHTAIISSNQDRIAESFAGFVEEQFLAPEPIDRKLKSVDFAALASDWLVDDDRSASLSRFMLRLLPQTLSAIEETGLRSFISRRVVERVEALELAPLAAELLSSLVEGERHQRIFDEILIGLNHVLNDERTLDAIRERLRRELPSLFNLFRADAYLVRRFVVLISGIVEEARADPEHVLRRDFDRFVRGFIEKLETSPEYAAKVEHLKRGLFARPELGRLADEVWDGLGSFLQADARSESSLLEFHLARFLSDVGRKLASEPKVRADINGGMVTVLQIFLQSQKSEIARFIAEQIRSWEIAEMANIVELNIGRDLQYIRLNGTIIGGMVGLGLYAGERLSQLV